MHDIVTFPPVSVTLRISLKPALRVLCLSYNSVWWTMKRLRRDFRRPLAVEDDGLRCADGRQIRFIQILQIRRLVDRARNELQMKYIGNMD